LNGAKKMGKNSLYFPGQGAHTAAWEKSCMNTAWPRKRFRLSRHKSAPEPSPVLFGTKEELSNQKYQALPVLRQPCAPAALTEEEIVPS
jgi:hypothetical protein